MLSAVQASSSWREIKQGETPLITVPVMEITSRDRKINELMLINDDLHKETRNLRNEYNELSNKYEKLRMAYEALERRCSNLSKTANRLERLANREALPPDDVRLSMPIHEMEMPSRANNALYWAGIKTLSQLLPMTEGELMRTPNIGRKSLADIKATLARFNLRLGTKIEEQTGELNAEDSDAR
jgi:DNA-directed RNA polymerase alpha subunit